MRILVTGCSGFLGSRLLSILTSEGHEAIGTTRNHSLATSPRIRHLERPLDACSYAKLIERNSIEGVINTIAAGVNPAERDPLVLLQANTLFPALLATVTRAAGARLVIHIGSSSEYAPVSVRRPLLESDALVRNKLYGSTKAAGSLAFEATSVEVGLKYAVLRLFNIFGAGESNNRLFPTLIQNLSRGIAVPLSNGSQIRDFLFVDDACHSIIRFMQSLELNTELSGCYNLASGYGRSVREFAEIVARTLGAEKKLLRFGELPMRPDDLAYVVGDTNKLDKLISPSARVSIEEATMHIRQN